MLRSLKLATLLAAVALVALAFPLVALGQTAIPDPSNVEAFLGAVASAVAAGDWKWAAVLGVIGLTAAVRHFGPKLPKVGPYLASSRAGAITALVLSLLVALAPALAGRAPWSFALVKDAALLGFAAIGGWVGVRRIVGVVSAPADGTLTVVK